jgi:hypothetical protein
VIDQWQRDGWELVTAKRGRFRTEMVFRRARPTQRWGLWTFVCGGVVLLVVAALVLAPTRILSNDDPLLRERAEATVAIRALQNGDLAALEARLAVNRGQTDFAYFFASMATPRALGDGLGRIDSTRRGVPPKAGNVAHTYDLVLTDLAGTLALATHGTGDRALPQSWTEDFVQATTTPGVLYGESDEVSDTSAAARLRADQDSANKQNLLLLLSRGYWSIDFLKAVTAAYWDFDHANGGDAWPGSTPDDAMYASAPNGTHLTDGVLALTAALTANPGASEWAFTDFQPGTANVEFDGDDHAIGRFAHYLFFEHHFPAATAGDDPGETVGMTSALTALSSAIDSTGKATVATTTPDGPMADALVLQALAKSLQDQGGLFSRVWDVTKHVAHTMWHWVQHWGHRILDIVSFTPPPFGTAAAGTNAVWYTIEGDYADAGLSLAAAVPALAFVKIAKGVKTGIEAEKGAAAGVGVEKAAEESTDIAKAAKALRPEPWHDCDQAALSGGLSLRYGSDWTSAQRRAAVEKVKAVSEAASRGELKKTLALRSGSASSQFGASGGTVAAENDVDHVIDLQLGGSDDIANLKPLDRSVNRSLGKQIQLQLQGFQLGQPVRAVAICDR